MRHAGTTAGALSALAVTGLCAAGGDAPGVVVALVVATALAAVDPVVRRLDRTRVAQSSTDRGPPRVRGAAHPLGGWQREVAVVTSTGVVALVAIALLLCAGSAVTGGDGAGSVGTAASVLAVVPWLTTIVVLRAMVQAATAARLSEAGVAVHPLDLERAGRLTLVVIGHDALTRGTGSPAQVWTADGDLAGLARALVLGAADPPSTDDAEVFALARSIGLDPGQIIADLPRVADVPFDADRRRMTTVSSTDEGYPVVCRGAPEALWPLLVTSADGASAVASRARPMATAWAAAGLRVTAVATTTRRVAGNTAGRLESGLRLHDMVGFADVPLAGVREAVAELADLGVAVAMVSGDHRATAVVTWWPVTPTATAW